MHFFFVKVIHVWRRDIKCHEVCCSTPIHFSMVQLILLTSTNKLISISIWWLLFFFVLFFMPSFYLCPDFLLVKMEISSFNSVDFSRKWCGDVKMMLTQGDDTILKQFHPSICLQRTIANWVEMWIVNIYIHWILNERLEQIDFSMCKCAVEYFPKTFRIDIFKSNFFSSPACNISCWEEISLKCIVMLVDPIEFILLVIRFMCNSNEVFS